MRVRERYELAGELRDRYAAAGRSERSEILNGFCLATRYERKHAIKMLRGREQKPASRPGRRRQRLVRLYTGVSPLTLKRQIDRRLAAMPAALEVTRSA